jgi:hypothetical protein
MVGFLASSESSPSPEQMEFCWNFLTKWNFVGISFSGLLARIAKYLLNGSPREVKFRKVVLLQLESLGAEVFSQIESLMTAMYTVSIPEFKLGNRLYPVLKICTASIIMHHIDFQINCLPQSRVLSMLRAGTARAKISDPRVPQNLGSQAVLDF